jgi:hypothetical protein
VTAPDECGFAVMLLRSLLTVSDGEEPELTGEDFEQAKNRSLSRGARAPSCLLLGRPERAGSLAKGRRERELTTTTMGSQTHSPLPDV